MVNSANDIALDWQREKGFDFANSPSPVANGLVSVVIPTFNRAYCVVRTIESVLSQSYQPVEVLIIDDGSTDHTRELIASRYANEPRVRYVYQANQGVSRARNRGLQEARGEFIALLDSDDYWYPWKVAAQVAVLRRFPDVGMVWTDMEAIDPTGAVYDLRHLRSFYHAYRYFTNETLFNTHTTMSEIVPDESSSVPNAQVHVGLIFSQMIMGSLVHTSTVILRRQRLEQVDGFNPELKNLGEDYDFFLRVCRQGPVALIDASAVVYTRGAPDRLTRSEHRMDAALNFLNVITPYIKQHRDEIKLPDSMIHQVMADSHSWIGEVMLDRGDTRMARRHLGLSLWHQPWQVQTAALLLASLTPCRNLVRTSYRQLKSAVNQLRHA